MLKRWFIAFFLFSFFMPTVVQAHSILESSQPKEGETTTEPVKELSLTFSTKVENGSRFSITNESGDTIEPTNITTEGDTLSGVLASPLNDGQYTVEWMIIGADGHPIEGNYVLTVKSESQEDVPTQNETESDHNDDQTEVSDSEENTEQKQVTSKQANDSRQKGVAIVLGIIFAISIACFVAVFWLMKKSGK